MTKMRQMSKAIFVLVAVAFIALIVFEWGADVNRGQTDTTVGKVNGEELSLQEFNEMYQQLVQSERERIGREPDERSLEQLRNRVWEQFIQVQLFKEEMDRLNISVTDSEVVYQIMNHPREQIKSDPSLQTNGVFDMQKYRAALNNPNIPWLDIENFYRSQIPFQKLQNIITNSVRVSDEEVIEEYRSKNIKAKVEYLGFFASRFQDNIQVTEDEIKNYYEQNKEDYEQNEQRDLAYVVFPLDPTSADTQRVLDDIDRIKERYSLGEDFNTLALEFSEDPSVSNNNGDLGYFDRSSMVKPFSDAAFAAEIGDLVGPVKTQFGYHLILVEDKKVEDGTEKVKASHILLKVVAGPSTIIEQEEKARIFSEDAQSNGWDETAQEYDYEIKTTGFFEEKFGFIPEIGRNPAIIYWAFSGEKEDISGLYNTDLGYTVLKIADVKKEGYKDLDQVRVNVESKLKLEKAKNLTRDFATNMENMVATKPFEEIAVADTSKKITYDVTPLFTIDQNIPRIGRHPEFNATAFTLEPQEISALIETDNAFYYQKLLEKTSFDSTDYNVQKSTIRNRLLTQKRNQIFNDWYEKLKEKADIVDNRKKFYIF